MFRSAPNHAVTIVGWDDTFSKDNFAEGHKPSKDGAYIVLNSYGKEFGNNGYFYVSYDDFAIEQTTLGISKITDAKNSSNITKYNYQYDELGANQEIIATRLMSRVKMMYGANVFTKQDKTHIENLTEVGVTLLEASGVEVYVNANGDDLNSSELVATYTGENALEAGYHVLKLSSPVALKGDKFAVIIKYINEEGTGIPIECNFKSSGNAKNNEELQKAYEKATSNEKESFVSTDGKSWSDLYNLKAGDITYKDTNTAIKAFTEQGDEKVNATGVELDKSSITIQIGDQTNLVATVKPTNAMNKNVKWTSSNPKIATISEKGIITALAVGETTITVTTEDGNFTSQCKINVTEKTNSDNDIYKDNNKEPSGTETQSGTDIQSKHETLGSTNKQQNSDSKTATTNLPQTGSKSVLIIVLALSMLVVIARIKCKKYKNIK